MSNPLGHSAQQGGNAFSGIVSAGAALAGNNISGRNVNIGFGLSDANTAKQNCMNRLFVCFKVDERDTVITRAGRPLNSEVCHWIADSKEYQTWSDPESGSKLMWIQGGPGTGKSMLSAYLSQQLEQRHSSSKEHLVLYHFCGGLAQNKKSPICVVSGLLWELCKAWDHLYERHLHEPFLTLAENLTSRHSESSVQTLWRLCTDILKSLSGKTIFFIIDGLDALAQDKIELIYLLRKITAYYNTETEERREEYPQPGLVRRSTNTPRSQSCAPALRSASARAYGSSGTHKDIPCAFKILLLSRGGQPNDLEQLLQSVTRLDLDQNLNEDYGRAFQTYVRMEFDRNTKTQQINAAQREAALQALEQRQDTSFIPVNRLFEQKSEKDITTPDVIASFPNELEDIYLQALEAIPSTLRYRAASVMRWALASLVPLKIDQMSDAITSVAQGVDQQTFSISGISTLLKVCSAFLTLEEDGIWYKDQSAIDFLLSTNWRGPRTSHLKMFYFDRTRLHDEVAKVCIMYVANEKNLKRSVDFRNLRTGKIQLKHPFLHYAVIFWPEHARLGELNGESYHNAFFQPRSKPLRTWWECYFMSTGISGWALLAPKNFTLLHLAACFGLQGLAQCLHRQGFTGVMIWAYDTEGKQPLDYALTHNRLPLVRFLLEHGAPLNEDKFGDISTLHYAAGLGNLDAVRMILDITGAPVDFTCSEASVTNLKTWKSVAMHPRFLMKEFLSTTADNQQNQADNEQAQVTSHIQPPSRRLGYNIRPLHFAATYGHEELMRYLLSKGANPSTPTSLGMTPLHMAAFRGQTHILQLLIDECCVLPSLESNTSDHWKPLHLAALSCNAEAIYYLLSQNANPNAVSKKLKTPLHVAMQHCQVDVAEITLLLLMHGATVDAVDHKRRTPLYIARNRGMTKSIQVLTDFGANPWWTDDNGEAIYQKAVKAGQHDIVCIFQRGPRPAEELMADFGITEGDKLEDEPSPSKKDDGIQDQSQHPCSNEKLQSGLPGDTNDPLFDQVYHFSTLFWSNIYPACQTFIHDAPTNASDKRRLYGQLTGRIETQIIEPLDQLQLQQFSEARLLRKEVIECCYDILKDLDMSLVIERTSRVDIGSNHLASSPLPNHQPLHDPPISETSSSNAWIGSRSPPPCYETLSPLPTCTSLSRPPAAPDTSPATKQSPPSTHSASPAIPHSAECNPGPERTMSEVLLPMTRPNPRAISSDPTGSIPVTRDTVQSRAATPLSTHPQEEELPPPLPPRRPQ